MCTIDHQLLTIDLDNIDNITIMKSPSIMQNCIHAIYLPCTVRVAISLFSVGENTLHNISVLLYSDDTVTDKFLLINSVSNASASS